VHPRNTWPIPARLGWRLARLPLRLDDGHVEAGRLVEREEVVAMLFAIAYLNAKVGRILQLLEEEFGGGEALPKDDT
jgi:hypothetical protein